MIQVGDLGLGFVPSAFVRRHVTSRNDLWFIRGNHDSPAECRKNPRYLGDFGSSGPAFWVSGAWSIDQRMRTEGVSWWKDEELSSSQMREAFDLYCSERPRMMITHDGPLSIFEVGGEMEIRNYQASATASLLQAMLESHQPEMWVFGHHHVSREFGVGPTCFRCLAELENWTYKLPDQ